MHSVMMLVIKELIVGLLEPGGECSILNCFLLLYLLNEYFLLIRFNDVSESSGECQFARQGQVYNRLTIIVTILSLDQLISAKLN